MPDRRRIKILSVLMAEDVRQEVRGQQTVVGVIAGRLIVASVPLFIPKLAFRIEFDCNESFSSTYDFAVMAPSGEKILHNAADIHVREERRNVFMLAWSPVQFMAEGRYVVQFRVDPDKEREVAYFDIVVGPKPIVTQASPSA